MHGQLRTRARRCRKRWLSSPNARRGPVFHRWTLVLLVRGREKLTMGHRPAGQAGGREASAACRFAGGHSCLMGMPMTDATRRLTRRIELSAKGSELLQKRLKVAQQH